jgi:hypothetical protein
MNRPHPSLSQHLLTRSDLAQLEIPAARILHWLSKGWLEQIAAIPVAAGPPNPVFAVLDGALREELASRLVELGKSEVVFSPLRVRSVLLRNLIRGEAAGVEVAPAPGDVGMDPANDSWLEQLADPVVTKTLELAAAGLAEEAKRAVALARSEAHLELLEQAVAAAVAQSFLIPQVRIPGVEESQSMAGDQELDIMDKSDDEDQFFDAGDLLAEFEEESPTPVAEVNPPTVDPAAEPLPTVTADVSPDHSAIMVAATAEVAVEPDTPPADDVSNAVVVAAPVAAVGGEASPAPVVVSEDVEQVLDFLAEGMSSAAAVFASSADPEASFHETEPAARDSLVADLASPTMADPVTAEEVSSAEPPPPAEVEGLASAAWARIEDVLGELRDSLVQIAERPQVVPVDVQPIAVALAENSKANQSTAENSLVCLRELSERVTGLGERLEHGLALAVHAAMSRQATPTPPTPGAPAAPVPVVIRTHDPTMLVVAAAAFLLACWSAVLWWKTGNAKLAGAILVGANAVGCCLLLGRRRA